MFWKGWFFWHDPDRWVDVDMGYREYLRLILIAIVITTVAIATGIWIAS